MDISSPVIRKFLIIRIYLCIIIIAVASIGFYETRGPNFQQGMELYKTYCVACHGINGDGVLYSKTALNNDGFVTVVDTSELIAVILYGKEGVGTMPSWGKMLNDQEVAAVTTYIRQAWSNRADSVTPAMVKKTRGAGDKRFPTNQIQ
jgi:mono/diheme cytochrome c family protein